MPTRIPITPQILAERHAALITKGKRISTLKRVTQERIGVYTVIEAQIVPQDLTVVFEHKPVSLAFKDPAITSAIKLIYDPKPNVNLQTVFKHLGAYDTVTWKQLLTDFATYKQELMSVPKSQREHVMKEIYG